LLGLEQAHSPNAEDISNAYWVMLVLAGILIIGINAALVGVLVRFRGGRGREPRQVRGRGRTQARVAGGLGVLALALFVFGVVYTEKAKDVEASGPNGLAGADPLHIRAVGQQWIWRYEYPGLESGNAAQSGTSTQSFSDVFSYGELVVPVDTTVELDVDSTDVVHRWWVPALGGKVDAVPGHLGHTWFRADEEGTFEGQSAGFSGASYAVMRTWVRVVSPEDYQAWVTKQAADIKAAQTAVQAQVGATAPAAGSSPGPNPTGSGT
jgi:cytochrome c oxidase subunit II